MEDEPAENADEGSVLSPDELDITADEAVVEIEDGRYVISPSGKEPEVSDLSELDEDRTSTSEQQSTEQAEISEEVIHQALVRRLESANTNFGFDITARFEETVSQREVLSNDVVTTFENLVIWYAAQVGTDTPVEDVLGILLLESNLTVRFPPESLESFASAHGLTDIDPLGDLFSTTREAGGICFPPEGE